MKTFPRSPKVRRALLAALALAGTMALAGNRLFELRTSVIGLGGDPYQTLWRFDSLTKAIAKGSLSVTGDPIRNLGPLPWLPLHLLFGEPLAYNLVWLLQGPLTALATAALGRKLGLLEFPAGLAGILAAFAPYRIAQSLGHFGAMQVFWIPATLAAFLSWLSAPKATTTALLALLLIGTAWTEHTLFLVTLMAIAVACVVFLGQLKTSLKEPGTQRLSLGLVLLIVTGAILPFYREIAATARQRSALNPGYEQRLRFSPTLWNLFSWAPFHALRDTSPPYGTPTQTVADHVASLGAVAVILAGVSIVPWERSMRRRSVVFLVALTVIGVGFAVAPRAPPTAWILERLPIISALRTMDRFLALPVFALPLLAAGCLRPRPKSVSVLLAGFLLLEVLPTSPFPAQSALLPPFYQALAAERPGRILEVPAATDYLVASKALYASTAHGREVAGSIVFERVDDPSKRESLLRVPFLRNVLLLRLSDLAQPTFFGENQQDIAHAAFISEDIVAVVIHSAADGQPVFRFGADGPQPTSPDIIRRVREVLRETGFSEERVGEHAFLYRIPEWPPGRSATFIVRGEGWEGVKRRPDGVRQGTLAKNSHFEVRVVGTSFIPLSLTFRIADGSGPGHIQLAGQSGEVQTKFVRPGEDTLWALGALAPGRHAYRLSVDGSPIIVENPSFREDTRRR